MDSVSIHVPNVWTVCHHCACVTWQILYISQMRCFFAYPYQIMSSTHVTLQDCFPSDGERWSWIHDPHCWLHCWHLPGACCCNPIDMRWEASVALNFSDISLPTLTVWTIAVSLVTMLDNVCHNVITHRDVFESVYHCLPLHRMPIDSAIEKDHQLQELTPESPMSSSRDIKCWQE